MADTDVEIDLGDGDALVAPPLAPKAIVPTEIVIELGGPPGEPPIVPRAFAPLDIEVDAETSPSTAPSAADDCCGEYGGSLLVSESGGMPTTVTYFSNSNQIVANRQALVLIEYDGEDRPEREIWTFYLPGGTTIDKVVTLTHTWNGSSLVKSVETVVA